MQKFETTKLFWDEYLYKLVLTNRLAPIFREKRFNYSREVLDQLQQQYDSKEPLSWNKGWRRKDPVSEESFRDAQIIFKILNASDEYKLRVEGVSLSIYSNDKTWLTHISQKLHYLVREFWEPDPNAIDNLLEGVILVNHKVDFEYKVTLGQKKFDGPGLLNWYKNNTDKIKIGPVLEKELGNNGYVNNLYFYARDEKILQLLSLMCSNIRRVDKIVCKHDLDK